MDIPKSDLAPADVPQKGVNYFMINSYKYNDQAGRKALESNRRKRAQEIG